MILRIRTPREAHDIDLGPTAHVPLRGYSLRGAKVEGRSGDSDHPRRDWAALKRAQRAKGRAA